jgi:hypothetical protein
MLPTKKSLIPTTRSSHLRIDQAKADAYVLKPRDYEEIPEQTDEDFARGTFYIGGVPIPRGPGMKVRIDQAKRKAGMLPKVRRKKAR